ncbi:hypothetical protein Hanom_Chr05g00439081 [Helianthus anomalus]
MKINYHQISSTCHWISCLPFPSNQTTLGNDCKTNISYINDIAFISDHRPINAY